MADFDYTGYGPTSAGRAPSAAELRRATTNRYHSSRAIQAMQFIDPATAAASQRMVKLGMGKDKSPEAVRRTLYGTTAGQATLDAAFAARSAGFLGYGDPRQYSANITQMVSGGLRQSIRGGALDPQSGRMLGYNQRVSGNGMIAERAGITMQKKLLDNLYGEGEDADPRRLSGYDMTEASQVAARITGRRGMGNLMSLQKNADIGTRMGAAMQSEVDPNIREGLSKLTNAQLEDVANAERSGDSNKINEAIAKVTATMSDPKAKAAFENIAKSKDALVFNEKNAKQLSDTVKEVTKGMAALNDIYGDLSSDDAHAMLEQVHGGRITNKQQARAAARTVNDMRNAAEYSGMDPKQLMGLFAQQQQSLAQQLGDTMGLDNRSQSTRQEMASKLAAKFAPESAIASKGIAEAYKSLGLEGEGRSAEELAEDNAMMQLEATEKYGGYIYSQGDMQGLTEQKRERMREKSKQFEEASAAGDTQAMAELSTEMENIVGPDFAKQILSGVGKADMASGQVGSTDKIRGMSRDVLATNYGLVNQLTDAGATEEEAKKLNEFALQGMSGVRGLGALAEVEKIEATDANIKKFGKTKAEEMAAEEREMLRDQIFDKSGATEEQRELMKKTFYNEDGSFKEKEFKQYAEVMAKTDWTGGQGGEFDKNDRAEIRLAGLEKNDKRQRMKDEDGKISARSIAKAMLRGDVDNPLADADSAAAALDALKDAGVSMMVEDEEEFTKEDGTKGTRKVKRDLTDMYTSGIDLEKMDEDTLKKIDQAAGGEVNLVDRVNKALGTDMSREEFLEKSKTDKKIQDAAFLQLGDAGAEMGFQVGGARDNVSVMNDKVQELGAGKGERFQKLKALESLSPMIGETQMGSMTEDVLRGAEVNIGDLMSADEYDGDNWDFGFGSEGQEKRKDKDGKKYYAAHMRNSGKFEAFKDTIKSSTPEQLADIAKMQGSEKLLESMEAQIKAMEEGVEDGNTKMVDDKGKEHDLNQQTVNEYKAAMEQLRSAIEQQNGSQKVGVMTVDKLEVNNHVEKK